MGRVRSRPRLSPVIGRGMTRYRTARGETPGRTMIHGMTGSGVDTARYVDVDFRGSET